MGMREAIWALIVLLAAYIVWELYRALRARRLARRPAAAEASKAVKPTAAATSEEDGADDDGDFEAYAPAPRLAPATPAAAPAPAAHPLPAGSDPFQLELELRQLRRELAQLRAEFQAQRQETATVAADLQALRGQIESRQLSQSVSPEYDEALIFARRGLGADAIAERCGISVAEAQLVLSLARGGPSAGREGP